MRIIIFMLIFAFTNTSINSCNLCLYYPIKNPRLERQTIARDHECTCPCWQYPHTSGDNNFYKCSVCEHRLTPPNPVSKKGPKYKRYEEKNAKEFNPKMFIKKQPIKK